MKDIDDMLQKTSSLAKTCCLAVQDMRLLLKDIDKGKPLVFNPELYHVITSVKQETVCAMCVVGAIARQSGVPDNKNWDLSELLQNGETNSFILYNRLKFIDVLRLGRLNPFAYRKGWSENKNKQSLYSLAGVVRERYAKDIVKKNFEGNNLEHYIELYTDYAEIFDKQGL